jgi:pimeloyl-ACP methyl ester carboxylesterase
MTTLGETMTSDSLEAVEIGDTTQWIRIKGTDASNPVLLLIQQGPGLPMINETRRFAELLDLEETFTVVYWDQRGCGRSLRGRHERSEISVNAMVDDTVAVLELLRDRFGAKTYVAGFSFGATIGAYAAARRPDLVAALVAVGMDVDGVAAGNEAYDFALRIGTPPHLTSKQFSTRVKWATNFGGVATNETYASLVRGLLTSLVRSPDYSLADVVRTVRGITATQAALLGELATMDVARTVPALDVPVVIVQGRHDRVAPGEPAENYADSLIAPSKQLVWFEHSAHTPHLEEPAKFRDLLIEVRAHALASGGASRQLQS